MAFKYQRDPVEELLAGITQLRKDLDALEGAHNKTLPFRAFDNLPPGVEGQLVLADYDPPIITTDDITTVVS